MSQSGSYGAVEGRTHSHQCEHLQSLKRSSREGRKHCCSQSQGLSDEDVNGFCPCKVRHLKQGTAMLQAVPSQGNSKVRFFGHSKKPPPQDNKRSTAPSGVSSSLYTSAILSLVSESVQSASSSNSSILLMAQIQALWERRLHPLTPFKAKAW